MYKVFSDGCCRGNPGPGGWGVIVKTPDLSMELLGSSVHTTNNQMELQGAIEGLKKTPIGSSVHLVTDSQYVTKGISEWLSSWKLRGWRTSTKGAVKNKVQWQELDVLVSQRKVTVEWVRGHSGHPENERCDVLANQAIDNPQL